MAVTPRIVRVNSDSDRQEVETLFQQNIADENRFALRSRARDPLKGYPTYVYVARDLSGLAGALHAGSAVEQINAYSLHGLPPHMADEGAQEYAMLFSMAVRQDRRGEGIGRALLDELLPQLTGFKRLYVVTGPASANFYRACGFTVLPHAKRYS